MNREYVINSENMKKELAIQDEINESIDKFNSFYFDAGAGAGKTYSLQKSIEYILQNRSENLMNADQKILCITYTNAAKNEIIERIGQNILVTVSTIHEFLWSFISNQQPLLIKEHKTKIKNELSKTQDSLKGFTCYDDVDNKETFEQLVLNEDFLTIFYKCYSEPANKFKSTIKNITEFKLDKELSNVSNFKKVVVLLIRKNNLQKTLDELSSGKKIKVQYKPTRNKDSLSKFIISHDTLLDYSLSIISANKLLKRLFYDKYPYALIDEYQDTDKRVIEIFNGILSLSRLRNRDFLIGYFGDYMQSIYNNGVGIINELIEGFLPIKKKFNRRSSNQVIELIEKIRNDDFGQISIYDNFNDGSYKFYSVKRELFELSDFVGEKVTNDCACLLLKNDRIAEERNFYGLLEEISRYPRFSGSNYDNRGSEFLTNNLKNIGWFLREILMFIDFIIKVADEKSTVRTITNFMDNSSRVTYDVFRQLVEQTKSINSLTLGDYINEFSRIEIKHSESNEKCIEIRNILKNIFSVDDNSSLDYLKQIKNQAYEYFFLTSIDAYGDSENVDHEDTNYMDSFFDLTISEFISWYEYIYDDKKKEGVNYYTLHGSKGLEFDDVVVVLENNFSRKRDYIKFFFENYNSSTLTQEDRFRFNNVRNLLYVACSRAKKNVHVVYLDELGQGDIDTVKTIFGEDFKYD